MTTALHDPRILQGMKSQLALRQTRLDAGEKPLGWKVGFGVPAALERLKLDAPLVGFLTDHSLLPTEGTVSIASWTNAVAEPEIGVYLGRDLPKVPDRETVQKAIASIGPVIELADLNVSPDDVEAILVGNVFHRHIIPGRRDDSRAGCVLDGLVGRLYSNGMEIAATSDMQALTGDLVEIVQHVANLLAGFGEQLRAGEVIITGAIVPPVRIVETTEIRYTLDPVDTISIQLVT